MKGYYSCILNIYRKFTTQTNLKKNYFAVVEFVLNSKWQMQERFFRIKNSIG